MTLKVRAAHGEGIATVGIMRQVGRKFGQLLDVRMLQKLY